MTDEITVSIAYRRAAVWMAGIRFPAVPRDASSPKHSDQLSASYPLCNGAIYKEVRSLGVKLFALLHLLAELKNDWAIPLFPPFIFMA
jgi:hypothetical protein